jgi:hypothetical protein
VDQETRDRARPLKVWVSQRERAEIEARARASSMSLSAYLRTVGLGHVPRSVLDHEAVQQLFRTNADLGRLGSLLTAWLANRPGTGAAAAEVGSVLNQIQQAQEEIRDKVRRV